MAARKKPAWDSLSAGDKADALRRDIQNLMNSISGLGERIDGIDDKVNKALRQFEKRLNDIEVNRPPTAARPASQRKG